MISDCVSLLDKLGTLVAAGRFIAEASTFDAVLLWNGVVDILSPNKHGVCIGSPQEDDEAGASALGALSTVSVVIATVVSLIQFQARLVAVPRQIPKRFRQ
jgi:hypothetical protein